MGLVCSRGFFVRALQIATPLSLCVCVCVYVIVTVIYSMHRCRGAAFIWVSYKLKIKLTKYGGFVCVCLEQLRWRMNLTSLSHSRTSMWLHPGPLKCASKWPTLQCASPISTTWRARWASSYLSVCFFCFSLGMITSAPVMLSSTMEHLHGAD